jgi:hypothetical protein
MSAPTYHRDPGIVLLDLVDALVVAGGKGIGRGRGWRHPTAT